MENRCHPKVTRLIMVCSAGVALWGQWPRSIGAGKSSRSLQVGLKELIAANDLLTSLFNAEKGAVLGKSPERLQELLDAAVNSKRSNYLSGFESWSHQV